MTIAIHLLVIDTETGGLDPAEHCIIELAAQLVQVVGRELTVPPRSYFYARMVADRPVSPEAAAVNGYDERWDVDPSTESRADALGRFVRWCQGNVPDGTMWCGANVGFDLAFLKSDLGREELQMPEYFSYRKLDVQSLAFPLFATGRIAGVGLKHLRKWANVPGEQKHRAMDDVDDVIAFLRAYLDLLARIEKAAEKLFYASDRDVLTEDECYALEAIIGARG